jgi:hypothetical protein
MTRAEIAKLREKLTADYKRKVEALELVEQMLNQQPKSRSPTVSRNKVETAKVRPAAKVLGTTVAGGASSRLFRNSRNGLHWRSPVL